MPFTEAQKLEVKRRSHFCCAICHSVGVEIHHITPQSEGGDDSIDNAAPLCPSCHETYGANRTKQKFIREARDFWYELCEKRYAPQGGETLSQILALQEQSQREIANLRDEVLASLGDAKKQSNVSDLGISGVMQYVLSKYARESFPQFAVLFHEDVWADDDLPEIRQELLEQYGNFLAEKFVLHIMYESNIDLRQGFSEDEFIEIVQSLHIFAILLHLLKAGKLTADINELGCFSWQAVNGSNEP